jgi:hypothetical protein
MARQLYNRRVARVYAYASCIRHCAAEVLYESMGSIGLVHSGTCGACVPCRADIDVCEPCGAGIDVCVPCGADIDVCVPCGAYIDICVPCGAYIEVCAVWGIYLCMCAVSCSLGLGNR